MYLLYVDESGSHAGSDVFVLGGLAVHESDTFRLQAALGTVARSVAPRGTAVELLELHAAEMKEPRRVRWQAARKGRHKVSPWESVPDRARFWALNETYRCIASFVPGDPGNPVVAFSVVVDRSYGDHKERAYEELLHRFDEFLTRRGHALGGGSVHELGLVVHDRHEASERNVQGWTERWRRVSGRIGRLTHLADVPFFADSTSTRLLQAGDFVTWAAWRNYGVGDARWIDYLWRTFDGSGGTMHGLAHIHRGFGGRMCVCFGCLTRALPSR